MLLVRNSKLNKRSFITPRPPTYFLKHNLLMRKYERVYTHLCRCIYFQREYFLTLCNRCFHFTYLLSATWQSTPINKNKFHSTETEIQNFPYPSNWQSSCPVSVQTQETPAEDQLPRNFYAFFLTDCKTSGVVPEAPLVWPASAQRRTSTEAEECTTWQHKVVFASEWLKGKIDYLLFLAFYGILDLKCNLKVCLVAEGLMIQTFITERTLMDF